MPIRPARRRSGAERDRARGTGEAVGRSLACVLAGLLTLFAALTATALPEDRLQAIAITADRAERHERGGYTIYIGSVVLDQGSLHIEADRLTIFHDREAADRIVAVGNPARMRQQPAIDKGPVRAQAGVRIRMGGLDTTAGDATETTTRPVNPGRAQPAETPPPKPSQNARWIKGYWVWAAPRWVWLRL